VIIVDTSVWVDFLNGLTNPESQWLDLNLDRVRIGVPTIVLCEVLQGLRDDREAALVHAQLMHLKLSRSTTWPSPSTPRNTTVDYGKRDAPCGRPSIS
jgi:predicted nucleic acid-binding protein